MGRLKCDYSDAVPAVNMEAAPRRPRSEVSATALAKEGYAVPQLRPPPGTKLANVADLPFHNFEPSPERLRSPGHNLGGKIMKLLGLKKRLSSATTTTHFLPMEEYQPSMQTFEFQDLITHSTQFPTPMIEEVRKRYIYDSEDHSDNYVSDSNNCSSASIASSSRNSNSSAQSFDSNRSSGTPRTPFLSSGQLSNTQIMANILMSIMDEEDSDTSEELGSSEDEHPATSLPGPRHQPGAEMCVDSPTVRGRQSSAASKLDGPHESAWHEPRDEIFVDSPTARGRQSSASKYGSGRHALKTGGRSSVDGRLTSPGPSRRFGKLDLSRIEVSKLR